MSAPLWHMYRVIITPSRARNRLEKWPKSPYPHDNTPTSPITMWLKFNYYTSMNLNCDLNSILLVESSKMRRQRCRPPSILSLSLYRVTVSRECLFDLLLLLLFGAKFILVWLNFPCFVDNYFHSIMLAKYCFCSIFESLLVLKICAGSCFDGKMLLLNY